MVQPCRLGALAENGEGGEGSGSGGLGSLADSIMHQLLSKEVLCQPMQEIGARYPAWLAQHRCSP